MLFDGATKGLVYATACERLSAVGGCYKSALKVPHVRRCAACSRRTRVSGIVSRKPTFSVATTTGPKYAVLYSARELKTARTDRAVPFVRNIGILRSTATGASLRQPDRDPFVGTWRAT
jgi:hypothetical protein